MWLIIFVIILTSTVDLLGAINIGSIRLLGVVWSGVSFIAILVWLFKRTPIVPLSVLKKYFWFFILFLYFLIRSADSEDLLYAFIDLQALIMPPLVGIMGYKLIKVKDIALFESIFLKAIFVPLFLLIVGLISGLSIYVEGVGQKGFIGSRSISLYGSIIISMALANIMLHYSRIGSKRLRTEAFLPKASSNRFQDEKGANNILYKLSLFAITISMILSIATLSRTSILSSVLMAFIAILLTLRIKVFAQALFLFFILIFSIMQVPQMQERLLPKNMDSIEDITSDGQYTSGRSALWTFVIEQGLSNPFFGDGTGNVKILIEQNMRSSGILPHNEYIRLFFDGGITGVIFLLLGYISRLMFHLKKIRMARKFGIFYLEKWNLVSLLATISLCCSALFDNVFLYYFMTSVVFLIYAVTDKLNFNYGRQL